MPLTHRDYAALSADAYEDHKVGRRAPGQEEVVPLNGHNYKVLEHVNNRQNGYQGTIYQREDTGEIIVSHRGTEEILQDAVLADGGMVLARYNLQANDAIALTQRAVALSKHIGENEGRAPEVSVTGHSLGGALAQVTAHHFDLKGETFNAYGAASLGLRIPEGGNSVLNHAMASDPVSAASGHYGEVRLYARPDEIRTLGNAGFSNKWYNGVIPDSALVAAGGSLGAHKLGNFADAGSVLDDPATQALAKQNARMIDEYRDKMELLRGAVTTGARGVPGVAVDLYDRIRGPLDPGEPARKAAEDAHKRDGAMRMDSPGHPGNLLFQDALRGVEAQDLRAGRTPDQHSGQLAGSLAAEMHANGGTRIDSVLMSSDASRTFGVQGQANDPAHLRVSVATTEAMQVPLEQSSERVQLAASQRTGQEQERQVAQQQDSARQMHA